MKFFIHFEKKGTLHYAWSLGLLSLLFYDYTTLLSTVIDGRPEIVTNPLQADIAQVHEVSLENDTNVPSQAALTKQHTKRIVILVALSIIGCVATYMAAQKLMQDPVEDAIKQAEKTLDTVEHTYHQTHTVLNDNKNTIESLKSTVEVFNQSKATCTTRCATIEVQAHNTVQETKKALKPQYDAYEEEYPMYNKAIGLQMGLQKKYKTGSKKKYEAAKKRYEQLRDSSTKGLDQDIALIQRLNALDLLPHT